MNYSLYSIVIGLKIVLSKFCECIWCIKTNSIFSSTTHPSQTPLPTSSSFNSHQVLLVLLMCTNMLDSIRWSIGCMQPVILRGESESPTFSRHQLSLSPRLVSRIPLRDALVAGFILWRSQAGTLPTLSLWGQRPCHAQKALFSSNLPQPVALKSLCFFFHGGSRVLVWRVGDNRYPIIYGWALHKFP